MNEDKIVSKEKTYNKPELKVFGKLMELTKGSEAGPAESGGTLCNSSEGQTCG